MYTCTCMCIPWWRELCRFATAVQELLACLAHHEFFSHNNCLWMYMYMHMWTLMWLTAAYSLTHQAGQRGWEAWLLEDICPGRREWAYLLSSAYALHQLSCNRLQMFKMYMYLCIYICTLNTVHTVKTEEPHSQAPSACIALTFEPCAPRESWGWGYKQIRDIVCTCKINQFVVLI